MAELQAAGEITIGVKYDVPPFGFKNPQTDAIEGFDVDLGQAIADALGVEPNFIEAISDNRIPLLVDGTADLDPVDDDDHYRPRRGDRLLDPVLHRRGQGGLAPVDSDITGVEDLAGKKVCTATGSTYEENLKENAPEAELRLVDTYSECLELIQTGAVDAVSTDDVILTGITIQDYTLELEGRGLHDRAVRSWDRRGRHGVQGVRRRRYSGVHRRRPVGRHVREVDRAVHG